MKPPLPNLLVNMSVFFTIFYILYSPEEVFVSNFPRFFFAKYGHNLFILTPRVGEIYHIGNTVCTQNKIHLKDTNKIDLKYNMMC